jgi:hypothetical protein
MIRPQRDKAIMQHGSAAKARERWSWVAKTGERWAAPNLPAGVATSSTMQIDASGRAVGAREETGGFFDFRATQCHFVPRFGGPTKIRKPI